MAALNFPDSPTIGDIFLGPDLNWQWDGVVWVPIGAITLAAVAYSGDAADLTGALADARLSANVPLKNAANTFTAANTISVNGAASTPALSLTGTVFTGGTGTTTKPSVLLEPTGTTAVTSYNTAGTALGFNSPSGFTGNHMSGHVNGAAANWSVTGSGHITATRLVDINGTMGIWGGVVVVGTQCMFAFSPTTGYTGTPDAAIKRNAAGIVEVNSGTAGVFRDLKVRNLISDNTVQLKGFTVATLPAGTEGMTAYVTDATAPTYLGALTGGGAVKCPVFYDGAAWVAG